MKTIYGILLESCRAGVCEVYGEIIWKRIVQELNFEHESFTTLGRYDESLIEKVAECKIPYLNRYIYINFV
jgi:hypothetical protein